jgi:hypothetical protein
MDEDLYVTTTGRWQQVLMREFGPKIKGGRMKVTPFDLLIDYDLKMRDGSIPGSNFSEVWIRMFEVLAEHPELQQQFDLGRIFSHIARESGAKNVDEFRRVNVEVQPDQQVLDQAQAGNIVPIGR